MGETEDKEVKAMESICGALAGLDEQARIRVLRWAGDRFAPSGSPPEGAREGQKETAKGGTPSLPDTVEEFFAAAAPPTDAERALVVAYWLQEKQGSDTWASLYVNRALKNLGHKSGNITAVLDVLQDQTPALVQQTKKSGTTKQARKQYKLTEAGKERVRALIGQSGHEAK